MTQRTRKRILSPESSYTTPSEIGKLPPQAVDLEEAVLGGMLLEREALTQVIDILSPEAFYKEQNGRVFSAMKGLFQRSEPIDILTVTQELKRTNELEFVGGAYYVSALTNRIASSANIEFHARIVSQKYLQRELIRVSVETIKLAYEDSTDVFELLDQSTGNIFQLVEGNTKKPAKKISVLLGEAFTEIDNAGKSDGLLGVPSGFTALDRLTGGFQRSDLTVIAARPGMGKTAFVVGIAKNAAVDFNKPVALFSLEMSGVQLTKRLMSIESEILQDKILKGDLSQEEYTLLSQRVNKLSLSPIYIDDTPALSLFELRAKARRLKENQKIELIIIDYLQLMSLGSEKESGNREQEISTISRGIKSLAKELEIPIIALSQLSRQVENRPGGNKRPQLSDLRESGAIEQDADIVMFIYRPEYYGLETDETGADVRGVAKIIIAKNRHGALEDVILKWIAKYTKFSDTDIPTFEEKLEGIKNVAPLNANTDFLTDIGRNDVEDYFK